MKYGCVVMDLFFSTFITISLQRIEERPEELLEVLNESKKHSVSYRKLMTRSILCDDQGQLASLSVLRCMIGGMMTDH